MATRNHQDGVPAAELPAGLSFDDVTLDSGFTEIVREDISLRTLLTRECWFETPLLSAPMDRVTEARLAIALGRLGGLGVIHRNLPIAAQARQVREVVSEGLIAAAAVSSQPGFEKRVEALIEAGVRIVVVDSAHGYSKFVGEAARWIKRNYPTLQVVGGNVATYDGAKYLADCGCDAVREGQGPGAICSTRIVSGVGTPKMTSISRTVRAGLPVWADGAQQVSGDVTKALGAGASGVMMGSLFAGTDESPGEVIPLKRSQVPATYHYLFGDREEGGFKEYRGMGSRGAIREGERIRAEGEFHDHRPNAAVVPEGVEGYVPVTGSVEDLVDNLLGGLKSGMYYVGARNIQELWEKARYIQITPASIREGRPHDVIPREVVSGI